MGMANDCNDSLTLTALGLEVMAMWQQRFDTTNDANLPVVRTLTGSSSLAREHEFLNLLVQSAHPSLLRRFKQIFPPFATITSKQMDVLQLFFSCGVFEPFHLYERYHPRYRREYFSSNHSSFMCAHDTQIHFSVPVVDAAKLDLLEELTSRPQLEKKQSSEVITRDSDGSGRVGSDDNDEELRPIEDELELGDIDVNWMRPSLPATVCATVHDTEQELWRLDMLNFNNEQAFVVARALKLALRKATLPAWLLGPNVEIPLRRIAFNTPESLTSLSLQQASAQEMLWLFTAIAAQPSAIANMSFKLCTFSLVSELFSPARQELGVSSFRVMERVTDLSITECTGLETSWLFEALVGNAPLALSIIKMPFGDDDFRNFTCANRLVSLRLERTEITGTCLTSILRACASSITALNLTGCSKLEFGVKGFNAFEYLSNLTDLILAETAVSDATFLQLTRERFSTLRKLDVSNPTQPKKLTSGMFEYLAHEQKRYPAMTWLSLGGCQLSGSLLKIVARLFDELQFLDLSGWSISSQEATNWLLPSKCFPRLQHLILPQMEEAIMAKFKTSHPHCKVMHIGSNGSLKQKKRLSLTDSSTLSPQQETSSLARFRLG